MNRNLVLRAAAGGAAILATIAARRLVDATWRRTTNRPPPLDPAHPRTRWGEALAWTVASAATIAVAQLLVQRGLARTFEEQPVRPAV